MRRTLIVFIFFLACSISGHAQSATAKSNVTTEVINPVGLSISGFSTFKDLKKISGLQINNSTIGRNDLVIPPFTINGDESNYAVTLSVDTVASNAPGKRSVTKRVVCNVIVHFN